MNGRRHLRTGVRLACTALGFLALSIPMAGASQVRSVNLEEMTARAATIFSGRCIDVRMAPDETLGRVVSVAKFEVHRAVKGPREHIVTVRMVIDDEGFAGVPRFQRGEEVVLFLYGENALGLRAPVGLGQGRFKVARDKRGQDMALNDLGNKSLLRGLSAAATEKLARIHGHSEQDEDLGPVKLLDMAEALVEP